MNLLQFRDIIPKPLTRFQTFASIKWRLRVYVLID